MSHFVKFGDWVVNIDHILYIRPTKSTERDVDPLEYKTTVFMIGDKHDIFLRETVGEVWERLIGAKEPLPERRIKDSLPLTEN